MEAAIPTRTGSDVSTPSLVPAIHSWCAEDYSGAVGVARIWRVFYEDYLAFRYSATLLHSWTLRGLVSCSLPISKTICFLLSTLYVTQVSCVLSLGRAQHHFHLSDTQHSRMHSVDCTCLTHNIQ